MVKTIFKLLAFVFSIVFVSHAFAEPEMHDDEYVYEESPNPLSTPTEPPTASTLPQPSLGLSGLGQVLARNNAPPLASPTNTLRAQLRLDGWIGLGENKCFKVQARLTTGSKYNSESITTSAWNAEPDFNIGLRRLYIDTNCVRENLRLQIGSAPSDGAGKLGLSSSGWIDGARIFVSDVKNQRMVTLSVGNVSNLDQPNISERQYDKGVNYTQIEAIQVLNGGHDVFASVVSYSDDIYTRVGIKWAVVEYLKWLQNLRGEVLYLNSRNSGYYLGAEAAIEKWRVNAYFIELQPSLEKAANATLVLNSFYGLGRNTYFEVTRPIDENWTFFLRNRQGDAGRRTETGVNRKF